MHPDLRLAGALPPLDAPHHMRATEWAMYREGVVVNSVPGEGSLLNVGLDKVPALASLVHSCILAEGVWWRHIEHTAHMCHIKTHMVPECGIAFITSHVAITTIVCMLMVESACLGYKVAQCCTFLKTYAYMYLLMTFHAHTSHPFRCEEASAFYRIFRLKVELSVLLAAA